MQISEMSNTFDILYNNVTSNQAPGLNEAEKSVFLTKAQNMLVREYFNTRTDGFGGGFDGSQQRQYDFSKLIKTKQLNATQSGLVIYKIDARGHLFDFPDDYFLSVNEVIKDDKYQYSVIPLTYAEYNRLMMKPYNYPVKRAVWRLFNSGFETKNIETGDIGIEYPIAEIIGKCNYESEGFAYTLRYVKKLNPIILDDLTAYGEDFSIDGKTKPTACELPAECHQEVVERAVTLAKIAWQGGTVTQAAASRDKE